MKSHHSTTGRQRTVLAVRAVTSRVPRIRGVGVLLAWVSAYFRRTACCDVEVSVLGQQMLLNTGDAIGNMLIFTPQWHDYRERALIRKIVAPGDYVVDIGANVGVYTLLFAALVGPGGSVTAIEAEPVNAQRLLHNVRINAFNWVTVHNAGVSDAVETLPMLLNTSGNAGAHSFFLTSADEHAQFRNIECSPLYGLLERKRPKLFKLDIEGFEWRVLRRFFEDAAEGVWPDYVLLEDDPKHREGDTVALLETHGYEVLQKFDNNTFMQRSVRADLPDPGSVTHG